MKKIVFIIALIAISFTNSFSQTVDLKRGLISYYPFNSNSNDDSGNNNSGSANNVSYVNDRNQQQNSACYFNGNSYISIPSNVINNLSSGSISVWINLSELNKQHTILDKTQTYVANYFQFIIDTNNKLRVFIHSEYNSSVKPEYSNTVFQKNQWYHIVFTWNSSNWYIYINDKLDISYSKNLSIPNQNRQIYIGKVDNNTAFLSGTIDELRIYNRNLNEDEIHMLYSGQTTETIIPPAITWENPYNYNSNTEQENYKIKACIKSKKQLSTLQIYINNSLYRNILERGFNVVPSGGCDFVVEQDINLSEGNNQIKIIAANQGGSTTSEIRTINYQPVKQDNTPPTITLINPQVSRGFKQIEENEQINILGKATDESGIFKVTVNGTNASVSADGTFQANVLLAFGDNTVTIKATDTKQNTSEFTFYVNRKSNQVVNNVVVNVNNRVDAT